MLLRKDDPQLTRALAPTIEEAITTSVRRNPRPLADALFPIFGPAIRKAIAASLSTMLESLNQTLEHSLSWRAVQWRVTALRTGKSFAEVVLLNTLVYRVEQVFLIERESGLLLLHVKSGLSAVQDVDMVSGMLTAIRDFAQDSFRVSKDETLDTLQVGELSVWIEQGPHAVLAAVIRGTAPSELRTSMQEALEHVHARFGETLSAFEGDTAPFEAARPSLEALLQSQYHRDRKKSSPMLWVLGGALVLTLAVWAYFAVSARTRWHAYLNALRAEPGIVVVSAEKAGGKYVVRGLRDPLARDPASFVAAAGLTGPTSSVNGSSIRRSDPVSRRRASAAAAACARECRRWDSRTACSRRPVRLPPRGSRTRRGLRPWSPVCPVSTPMPLIDARNAVAFAAARSRQPALPVRGSTTLEAGGEQVLAAQARTPSARWIVSRHAANRRYTVQIVGHTDADGPDSSNDPLSANRATTVRTAVESLQLRGIEVDLSGRRQRPAGETRPPLKRTSVLNRRVSIRVLAR